MPADVDPIASLRSLPVGRQNAILAYLDVIQSEALEPLAVFLKAQHPDFTDHDIACMLGISLSTLNRWPLYRAIKPKLADYPHIRRQPTHWRKTRGGRSPLDPPDSV